jgi:hypothetical protein
LGFMMPVNSNHARQCIGWACFETTVIHFTERDAGSR